MIRRCAASNGKAFGLCFALLAVTLDLLQPIVHAAVLREGAPGALWAAFCQPAGAGHDSGTPVPGAMRDHECCLGLAHAATVAAPPTAFVVVEPAATAIAPSLPAEQGVPVGTRDGLFRPRGPPSLA